MLPEHKTNLSINQDFLSKGCIQMQSSAPQTIYLKDYTPFGFHVQEVHLTFDLAPNATHVTSRVRFAPIADAADPTFFLHGENLTLLSAKIDGEAVTPKITPDGLTCDVPDMPFTWEAEVKIDPAANTALEGLYLSNGMYCTQCEAEGFRKITYYPDRPDVMSLYRAHQWPARHAFVERQPCVHGRWLG